MTQQNYQQYILEAIETVTSDWDIEDEYYLADAIQSQAQLLAGLDSEQIDSIH